MKFKQILIFIISILHLVGVKYFIAKYLVYGRQSEVKDILQHLNKHITRRTSHLKQCAESDAHKYYHPDSVDELVFYDDNYRNTLVRDESQLEYLCLFQKAVTMPFGFTGDECRLYEGIDVESPDVQFNLYLLIASTDPLLAYLNQQVQLSGGEQVSLEELSARVGIPLETVLKQFAIQIVLFNKYPTNMKLSILFEAKMAISAKKLRLVDIVQPANDSYIAGQSQVLLHQLVRRRYRDVKSRIQKILRNKIKADHEIVMEILHMVRDRDVAHDTGFVILIDQGRLGERAYNFIRPVCPVF